MGRQIVAVKVMEVPFQQKPVYYKKLGRDKGSFCRSSTSSVLMTREQVRQLLVPQVELRADFSARLISSLPDAWYDPLEVERMRRILRVVRTGSDLPGLPDNELLSKLSLTATSWHWNRYEICVFTDCGQETCKANSHGARCRYRAREAP